MNDEEKASIKHLDNFMERIRIEKYPPEAEIGLDTSIECILNLIEKQEKEIEELKNENEKYEIKMTDEQYSKVIEIVECGVNLKWKTKIKATIENFKIVRDEILKNEKELNRPMMTYDLIRNDYCERMLEELLKKE